MKPRHTLLQKNGHLNKMGQHQAGRHRVPEQRSGVVIRKILVPIDFSLQSRRAVEYAARFARQFGSSIALMHVVKPKVDEVDYGYGPVIRRIADPNQIKRAESRLSAIRKTRLSTAVDAATLVRIGVPDSEIVRAANELGAGLIVMGAHSLPAGQVAPLEGVAQSVVGRAPCPVLVVRAKGPKDFPLTVKPHQ